MPKLPNVAVIIANHNYSEYICGAIASAVNQNYFGDIKVVVIDDKSTDSSINNIVNYINKNGNIVTNGVLEKSKQKIVSGLIKNREVFLIGLPENVKQGAARNIGIKSIWDWADYFAILDSDDEMMVDKISLCIDKALEYPDIIGSVHTDYCIENTDTGLTTLECKSPFSKQLLMLDCHLHSGGVISKIALTKVGLFDEDCVPKEDYHIWLKISDFFMCVHIPEPLVKVRVTPKNSTISIDNARHMEQYRKMGESYKNWRSSQGLPV